MVACWCTCNGSLQCNIDCDVMQRNVYNAQYLPSLNRKGRILLKHTREWMSNIMYTFCSQCTQHITWVAHLVWDNELRDTLTFYVFVILQTKVMMQLIYLNKH
jgi:hypothetical protein